MNRLIRSVVFLAGVLLAATLAAAQPVSLTILHTNDTHGHLQPFSYPDAAVEGRELQGLRTYKNIGGIARRATLVARIRAEQAKHGVTTWLVDAGDYSDGTPFSVEYHGEADVAAMNALHYDLGTLGNHEFNNTAAQLRKLVNASQYQVLCANISDRSGGKPLGTPYVIRHVGPIRIGIFGLTTYDAATYPAAREAFDFVREVDAARKMVDVLRKQVDVILVVSHAGEQMDERLAAEVPDIDIIVGGHSHSRLPSGEFVWHSEDLRGTDVNGTVIVQAHQWGGELGRLDLLFDKDAHGAWHVERYRARLIPVTEDIPEDPDVAAVVNRFWQPIAARYGEVIGQAAGEFASRGNDLAEYNLMADALRETFKVDFAIENTGGVRSPLLRGPITLADLVTLDPFNNTVVLFTLTGRQIKQILQQHTPTVSGLRYRVQDHRLVEATLNGQPLDDDRTYTGVTNSYFKGTVLKAVAGQDTGKPRLNVLIEYIRQKGTIRPEYDGRRVVVNQ